LQFKIRCNFVRVKFANHATASFNQFENILFSIPESVSTTSFLAPQKKEESKAAEGIGRGSAKAIPI